MATETPEADDTGAATSDYKSDLEFLEADETSETPEAPETSETSEEESTEDGTEETVDTPEEESEEEAEEEEEETKEEENEEESKEDAEFEPGIGRPSFKEIVTEFPELAKKFPAIREIYYREAAFTEIFPTVDDAKEAVAKSEALDFFDSELVSKGDPAILIKNLPTESVTKIAARILPALAARDQKLYIRAIAPVLKHTLRAAAKDAKIANNEHLYNACEHIHMYMFETPDLNSKLPFDDVEKEDPVISEKKKELDTKIAEFNRKQSQSFDQGVEFKAKQLVSKELDKAFDPNKTLGPEVRKRLINSIITEVDDKIAADSKLMQRVKDLRIKAAQNGFTNEYKTRIISAYLGAFKALVGPIRQRVMEDALGKTVGKTTKIAPVKKRFLPAGNSERPQVVTAPSRNLSPKSVDWSKTSDLDFLSDKVTLKRGVK